MKLAVLDLGSNSFHLHDADCLGKQFHYNACIKEKVQIGAGLDADHNLSQVAINRGLECLKRFADYIAQKNIQHVVAVGTNALRIANNRAEFISAAEKILNFPVHIISGKEEARLIFCAVSLEVDASEPGLVIDIGGGSTEFASGNKNKPSYAVSIEMGCVSYYQRFFADGKIYSENVRAAEKAALLEIEPYLQDLLATPKHWIAGTSGTLQSIARLTQHFCGDPPNILHRSSIDDLEKRLILTGHVKSINFEHLAVNRRDILPAGLAIVKAIFTSLDLQQIQISRSALGEGLLLELSKKVCH